MTIQGAFRANEWIMRRARGRLRPALTLILAVDLAYLLAWAVDATVAWLLVRGPRQDMWSLVITVPMMALQLPWLWSWPAPWLGCRPDLRANVATSMRLGASHRTARIVCLAGTASTACAMAAVVLGLLAAWLL